MRRVLPQSELVVNRVLIISPDHPSDLIKDITQVVFGSQRASPMLGEALFSMQYVKYAVLIV